MEDIAKRLEEAKAAIPAWNKLMCVGFAASKAGMTVGATAIAGSSVPAIGTAVGVVVGVVLGAGVGVVSMEHCMKAEQLKALGELNSPPMPQESPSKPKLGR